MCISVVFSRRCAWRAVYVSRMAQNVDYTGRNLGRSKHQFFHIGIDPNTSSGSPPCLFGEIVNPWNRRGFSASWRIPLPHIPWKVNAGRVYLLAYRVSSRFWRAMRGDA